MARFRRGNDRTINQKNVFLSTILRMKIAVAVLLLIAMMSITDKQNESNNQMGTLFVSANRQRRKREKDERDITATEVEEITDDKTIEDDPDELAKKAMMEEWDEHMSDFVPNDMLSVQLNPREEIVSIFNFTNFFAKI